MWLILLKFFLCNAKRLIKEEVETLVINHNKQISIRDSFSWNIWHFRVKILLLFKLVYARMFLCFSTKFNFKVSTNMR